MNLMEFSDALSLAFDAARFKVSIELAGPGALSGPGPPGTITTSVTCRGCSISYTETISDTYAKLYNEATIQAMSDRISNDIRKRCTCWQIVGQKSEPRKQEKPVKTTTTRKIR